MWGWNLRRKIKLLQQWVRDDDEDTRTMAYMLLSVMSGSLEGIKEKEDGCRSRR